MKIGKQCYQVPETKITAQTCTMYEVGDEDGVTYLIFFYWKPVDLTNDQWFAWVMSDKLLITLYYFTLIFCNCFDQFTGQLVFWCTNFVYTQSLVKACKVIRRIFFEIKLCNCVIIWKFIDKKLDQLIMIWYTRCIPLSMQTEKRYKTLHGRVLLDTLVSQVE